VFAGDAIRLTEISEGLLVKFAECSHVNPNQKQRRELAGCVWQVVRDWNPDSLPKRPVFRRKTATVFPDGSLRRYVEEVYIPTELINCTVFATNDARRAVRCLDEHLGRFVAVEELADSIAAGFFQSLFKKGYPATTVNKYRRNLFSVWRHAYRGGLCLKTPGVKKLKENREDPEAWTVEEFARILAAAATLENDRKYGDTPTALWWTAILNCAYWTGLRVGSILKIRESDLDLRSGWLSVPGGNTKTRRAKRCRLHPTAVDAIGRITSLSSLREDFVFVPHPDRSGLYAPFDEILLRANVPRSKRRGMNRFHKVRRTAATAAYQAGGINAAAALLDHSDTRVTFEHYIDGRAIRDNDSTLVLPVPQLKLA